MPLEYVPLLRVQRELHDIPRGRGRFESYLETIQTERRDDVRLPPLVAMNPMAREHVTSLLDALLAIDADGLAAEAVRAASDMLEGSYKVALVVADDAKGGWTNRWAAEYAQAFESEPTRCRGWISGLLWSSEPASARAAIEAALTAVHRVAHVERHGPARTLRDRLAQEGYALAWAGSAGPTLDPDDLAYSREVIGPHLDATDRRTGIECLYGDAAARSLGLTPRGLSERAGLALARDEARSRV